MHRSLSVAIALFLTCLASSAFAQEKCFADAKKEITDWASANSGELLKYADQMDAARKANQDPNTVLVTYSGIQMPLSAAYLIVHQKFDSQSKAVIEASVEKSKKCATKVGLQRGAYDYAREYLGLETVLPERATRVDFAELQAGNIFGGKDALVPKALEDARKAEEKALEDVRKAGEKAGKDLNTAVNKARDDIIKAADPRHWHF